MLTIDINISTFLPEGIKKVETILPLPRKGVTYIISWQKHEDYPIPDSLSNRSDVKIFRLGSTGLSKNRNNAIDLSTGDIIVIADDDLFFDECFDSTIRSTFDENTYIDLALFKVSFPFKKKYPGKNMRIKLPFPKGYYVSSVEIAFRRDKINGLRFWEEMGLGALSMHSGEDELFVISAIRRGINCKFINKYIAYHSQTSTGQKTTSGILKGQGFITGIIYPFSGIIRVPLKAYRISRHNDISFFKALMNLSSGFLLYTLRLKKIPQQCRW